MTGLKKEVGGLVNVVPPPQVSNPPATTNPAPPFPTIPIAALSVKFPRLFAKLKKDDALVGISNDFDDDADFLDYCGSYYSIKDVAGLKKDLVDNYQCTNKLAGLLATAAFALLASE